MLPEAHASLVFIDGHFSAALSSVPRAQRGVLIGELGTALRGVEEIERTLGRIVAFDQQLFVALNTAFLRDGAVIALEREQTLPGPVHILHVATERPVAHAIYPRTLVLASRGSKLCVIEDFVALGTSAYFSAPVTEIALAENARVEHIRVQRDSERAFHLGACGIVQSAASRYCSVHVGLGARISRLEHRVTHQGEGCETELRGLTLIGERQLGDVHSFVDHAKTHGRLDQIQKCIARGAARAVFNGKVMVRAGALRTNAAQSCRGLLLSDRARIDAKPQLEIFADDVKCAHGAAIGQLDADEVFYLRTRGLSEAAARDLLTHAFAAEIIERVTPASLAEALTRSVIQRTQEKA
jgi:Fe-S cluster assembly protein SufD